MSTRIHSRNINTCCRTCINDTSSRMYGIFEKGDRAAPADILLSYTSIKVDKEDLLPKKICSSCYNCLLSFYDFIKQAEVIDRKLRNHTQSCHRYEENKSRNLVDIKLEENDSEMSVDYDIFEQNYNESQNDIKHELYEGRIDFDTKTEIFFCHICNNSFENLSQLQKHNVSHSRDSNDHIDLKCNSCEKQRKGPKLELHKVKHVLDENLFTCDICSETFRQHCQLVKHLVMHGQDKTDMYKSDLNQNKNQRLKCDVCSANFKSVNSLSAHMRKHTKKGRILSCSFCDKIFKKVSHLKRHELCHEDNKPFKCTICPKSFKSENILLEHINKHNGIKPHRCPICSKSFSHLSTLTSHIKIHTKSKERPYLCPTCGKRFGSTTNLNQHLRRHTGVKLFACSLCPIKFVTKGELNSHTITHTGERSYTCEQCGAKFTKRSSLNKHEMCHTGIKPHQCDACSMRFTSKDHLKRHYRIHTGEKPYRCDMCERAFTQSNDLEKHRRAHLGDNLYKCDQCSESFRLKTELRRHISAHFISQLQAQDKFTDNEDKTRLEKPEIISGQVMIENVDNTMVSEEK